MANEAIIDQLDPNSVSQGKYVFPVQGCLFFGVPHKGAKIAGLASGLLTGLNKVFNVNKNNVYDLQPKSQRLACISSEFEATQGQLNFPVLSFYENKSLSHTIGLVSTNPVRFDPTVVRRASPFPPNYPAKQPGTTIEACAGLLISFFE